MNVHAPTSTAAPVAAHMDQPAPMDVQWTGQFLHDKADKAVLFFEVDGEANRCFTVLAALGYRNVMDAELDPTRNGVAIIDNDNHRVVASEILSQPSGIRGASSQQKDLVTSLQEMDWATFAKFCVKQPGYRAGSVDIDQQYPQPSVGNLRRQVALGLRSASELDNRPEIAKSFAELGLYDFPAKTYAAMRNEIMMRQTQNISGRRMISWNVSPNFKFDKSGVVEGGEEVNAQFDYRWSQEIAANDSILRQASDKALEEYVQPGFAVLDMGDDASCELITGGPNDDYIGMESFRGHDMSFKNFRELNDKLKAMPEADLGHLWMTVRTLDKDLGREIRAEEIGLELNSIRAELEADWVVEHDSEIDFDLG